MSRKVLYIGDVHATQGELGDCQKLVDYAANICKEKKAQACFLGDQHHHHAVMNVYVLEFWAEAAKKFKTPMFLVGNHDMPGTSSSTAHAMIPQKGAGAIVVDEPMVKDGILFVPYMDDPEEFVKVCGRYAKDAKVLVCHQTITGAQYENGFYAPDGVDPARIPQDTVISGHVHLPQTVAKKVVYVGGPRWRTLSDANVERALLLVEHADDGSVLSAEKFPTGDVCLKIMHLVDDEDDGSTPQLDEAAYTGDLRVDVKGRPSYVKERSKLWANIGAKVRQFPRVDKSGPARESMGITQAFLAYLESCPTRHKKTILNLAKDRGAL